MEKRSQSKSWLQLQKLKDDPLGRPFLLSKSYTAIELLSLILSVSSVLDKNTMTIYRMLRITSFIIVILIITFTYLPASYAQEELPILKLESGNLPSANASTSADGRFIAFHSAASNLIPGDTNNKQDIFVFDRKMKTMQRISVASDGEQANDYSLRPSISGDGRFVAFMSYAKNLVEHDHNHQLDVYIHDRQEKTTELVSVSTDGKAGNTKSMNPVISSDGRFVAFESFANNLIDEDINENLSAIAQQYNMGTDQIRELYEQNSLLEGLEATLAERKVIDFIVENAEIDEVPAEENHVDKKP